MGTLETRIGEELGDMITDFELDIEVIFDKICSML